MVAWPFLPSCVYGKVACSLAWASPVGTESSVIARSGKLAEGVLSSDTSCTLTPKSLRGVFLRSIPCHWRGHSMGL